MRRLPLHVIAENLRGKSGVAVSMRCKMRDVAKTIASLHNNCPKGFTAARVELTKEIGDIAPFGGLEINPI